MKTAALLAQEQYLTSVKYMRIEDMDISDIPSDQMDKLASIIIEGVWIHKMTPGSRVSHILASVQCSGLGLENMELSKENTRDLVTAMRTRVQDVSLVNVTLDIEELTQYDGQGLCSELVVCDDTRTWYKDRLRRWAADMGWTVRVDSDGLLWMKRRLVSISPDSVSQSNSAVQEFLQRIAGDMKM